MDLMGNLFLILELLKSLFKDFYESKQANLESLFENESVLVI